MPYIIGFAGLAVLWFCMRLATPKNQPLNLFTFARGEDGAASTSKFQLLVWTATVVFSYLAVYAIRIHAGMWSTVPNIPQNLLLALGISGVTAVGAKAIASTKASNEADAAVNAAAGALNAMPAADPGAPVDPNAAPVVAVAAVNPVAPVVAAAVAQPGGGMNVAVLPAAPNATPKGGIFQDDFGNPDLGKIQIVVWTFIGVGVYLTTMSHTIHVGATELPDIDRTLMILMGIGHSAYLGQKIAAS